MAVMIFLMVYLIARDVISLWEHDTDLNDFLLGCSKEKCLLLFIYLFIYLGFALPCGLAAMSDIRELRNFYGIVHLHCYWCFLGSGFYSLLLAELVVVLHEWIEL